MKLFKQAAKYGPFVALSVAAGNAMALPAGASDALTALEVDATALVNLMWPVVLAVSGGFALVTLVKKAIGRAV